MLIGLTRIVAIIMLLAEPLFATTSPIALKLSQYVGFAPLTVRVSVVVPHDKDNRQVCVALEGDTGYSRSSCYEHLEDAPLQTLIWWRDLPAGNYSAVGELTRAGGKVYRSIQVNLTVSGWD
jgi:hypothetical protein